MLETAIEADPISPPLGTAAKEGSARSLGFCVLKADSAKNASASHLLRESDQKSREPDVVYGTPLITPASGQALALRAGRRGRNLPFEPVLRRHGW